MSESHIVRPAKGEYIVNGAEGLQVPDNPIISFIEGGIASTSSLVITTQV